MLEGRQIIASMTGFKTFAERALKGTLAETPGTLIICIEKSKLNDLELLTFSSLNQKQTVVKDMLMLIVKDMLMLKFDYLLTVNYSYNLATCLQMNKKIPKNQL
jgi:hypothetical protein